MARTASKKRIEYPCKPDLLFQNFYVGKLVKNVMKDGKFDLANRIVKKALEHADNKLNTLLSSGEKIALPQKMNMKTYYMELLEIIFDKAAITRTVVSKRFHGQKYDIPTNLPKEKARLRGIKLIVKVARNLSSKGINMYQALGNVFVDIIQNKGDVLAQKKEMSSLADSNAAFAQFRS